MRARFTPMVRRPPTQDPDLAIGTAIDLMIRQGYNATSVDELATAAGISRSTFFRQFGSKEDVVFADHERLLSRVDEYLSGTTDYPLAAVGNAALMVFEQHVRNRQTSLLRNQLLHQVPNLRDRELVTAHRYERAFRKYLLDTVPVTPQKDYGAAAFAAAVVAVHNRALRQWFRDASRSPDARLDREVANQLSHELRTVSEIFQPSLFNAQAAEPRGPVVVVTVVNASSGTEEILEAVRRAIS